MDHVSQFIEERCKQNPESREGVTTLYQSYSSWAKTKEKVPCSMRDFNRGLRQRGFKTAHTEKGEMWQQLGFKLRRLNGSASE